MFKEGNTTVKFSSMWEDRKHRNHVSVRMEKTLGRKSIVANYVLPEGLWTMSEMTEKNVRWLEGLMTKHEGNIMHVTGLI